MEASFNVTRTCFYIYSLYVNELTFHFQLVFGTCAFIIESLVAKSCAVYLQYFT